MQPIVSISNLSKIYASGHHALKDLNLDIAPGEILALLGPNGAGKTTLISIICGIVNASEGRVTVGGHDIVADYRITRAMIGLVPQELTLGAFLGVVPPEDVDGTVVGGEFPGLGVEVGFLAGEVHAEVIGNIAGATLAVALGLQAPLFG